MASRITLNVSLTPELDQFIQARVGSGRYQTASEVVREGLRLLEEREERRHAALNELRELIAVGLEQANRGELLDGEEVMSQMMRRHDDRMRTDG
ncbi:MAG: type II toxin-antitoxin system ParD family antitoxin [Actinomycetota bacterium]